MLDKLLPCPFCGKKTELRFSYAGHREDVAVNCDASDENKNKGCGAECGYSPTEEEAVKAWNTRAKENNHEQ